MKRIRADRARAAAAASWIACTIGIAGCRAAPHDADWFLAHSDQLHAKLLACQADPKAAGDRECAAATDAFVRWYTASGLAARDTKKDLDALDARLTPLAPSSRRDDPADPRSGASSR